MKLVLILCFLSEICLGQTNAVRIFTTNYVAAASNFREVNGQLYNVEKSRMFAYFDGDCIGAYSGEVDMVANSGWYMGAGNIGSPWHGQTVVLLHYPDPHVAMDAHLTGYAARIGETNMAHGAYELWDCGTPHFVPVISSKLIKIK